jgi:rhamnosyltransferase subunit B
MSRIVLNTIGTFGDLHPKIAIALELRQRGHDVIFVTHREYREKIEALQFEFHPTRPDNPMSQDNQGLENSQVSSRALDLRTGTEYLMRDVVSANVRESYADLVKVAKDADLIIHGECAVAARLVAEKYGIPWVSLVLQPMGFLSVSDPSIVPGMPLIFQLPGLKSLGQQQVRRIGKIVAKSWGTQIHKFRAELGLLRLKGTPFIDDKYSPDLVLAMFSPLLAKLQPDWPTNTIQAGSTFYDGQNPDAPLPIELAKFLAAGEAPIVFTLGSAAVSTPGEFYAESVKAAKVLNRRAVLLIGQSSPPENLPNSIIAVDYVPHSQIFPLACAIVHQGGIGTMAQSLRAGRPTLVTPYTNDQPDNAARAERLGTSLTVSRQKYRADRVAQQLGKLLTNPSYAAKAVEVGKVIRAEDGAKVACDAIEQRLKAKISGALPKGNNAPDDNEFNP